jgi:fumarate reductase flavoprotein subunit
VHGANRLGGNGVANSTVYGGVAGEAIAEWVGREGGWREPDRAQIDAAQGRCERPFARAALAGASLERIRETLYGLMWDRVGIIRDEAGLRSAAAELAALEAELDGCRLPDANRAFNLSWHDWMNLKSLIQVSGVIAEAAIARRDSRGAHFRSDHPETGPLEQSTFTSARLEGNHPRITMKPVAFTRVRPGETLIEEAA